MDTSILAYVQPEYELDDIGKALCNAAKWLEANEWVQNKLHDGKHASCAVGSLERVGIHTDNNRMLDVCAERMGFSSQQQLIRWNDYIGRTKEEVVARFKEGAKKSCRIKLTPTFTGGLHP